MSRILIIDDDIFVGPKIRALLIDELHDAVLVRDAAGGIMELASSRFDLVFVDIDPARMDGIGLIARLRSLALTLPIIGMAGAKMPELTAPSLDCVDLAIEAGATCCIRQPLDAEHMLAAMKASLGLSNGNPVVKLQQKLAAEFSPNPEISSLDQPFVSRNLKDAIVVLRQYLQGRSHESDLGGLESTRDEVVRTLKSTERLLVIIEAKRGACDNAEVIALNERAIKFNPPLKRVSVNRDRLTPREREVLALVTSGVSNKVGGFRMSISVRTFEAHRANAMGKLGAKNAAELVRFGSEQAL